MLMKSLVVRALPLLAASLLPACRSVEMPKVPGVTPYRMVIQQGNFISQEMVAQLKPGMTREQVRFVLGTPLVTDIFHADRWDYIYFRELPNGKREQRNLTVVFEKDRLARVLGDLLPAEGAAPQAGGFQPLLKPEAPPKPPAKPAAEPAAEAAKTPAPAEAPKEASLPATALPSAGAAGEDPLRPSAAAPAPTPAESKPAEEGAKPAEGSPEPGFFQRMREKIGL
jgi:outer membrane protein assembly factor BamE